MEHTQVKADASLKTIMTCLQGYVEAKYSKIVEVFGEPNRDDGCDKVDAQWVISTPAGVATIYNYKDGKNYLGTDGKNVKNIKDWHIGGYDKRVVSYIQEALL